MHNIHYSLRKWLVRKGNNILSEKGKRWLEGKTRWSCIRLKIEKRIKSISIERQGLVSWVPYPHGRYSDAK